MLRVGDKVKLKVASRFYNQAPGQVGTVTRVMGNLDGSSDSRANWVNVEFRWGYENSYREGKDLELIETATATQTATQKRGDKMKKGKLVKMEETEGQKILLPKGMSTTRAIKELEDLLRYESTKVQVCEKIEGFIFDAAYALSKAIERLYGWSNAKPTPGFFGDTPPRMVSLKIGVNKTVQVPWGSFELPGIHGTFQTQGVQEKRSEPAVFMLSADVRQGDKQKVKALANEARKILKEESVYKGKAIRLSFDSQQNAEQPEFLDLNGINEKQLVFSEEVKAAIETSLFTPIDHADKCRASGIPLKRGILLSGPYGTGKTMAAYVSAKKAIDAKMTFIYCEKADDFGRVVKFAHDYQPCVIFCEDIDRVTAGERSVSLDDILNTIDGIESKHTEIVTVLTTNHVERINPAMLRPGRLDAVINVLPPDKAAVIELLKLYGGSMLEPGTDLEAAAELLKGTIPAVIRECVERAKLAAIRRAPEGQGLTIDAQAMLDAAMSLKNQRELLNAKKENTPFDYRFGRIMGQLVQEESRKAVKTAIEAERMEDDE